MADGVAAQSSGGDNANSGASPGIASELKSAPDGTTLGTGNSVSTTGDSKLSKPGSYKDNPSLLKSNKDIERVFKSICRGC